MFSIRLPEELETDLVCLAKQLHLTKSKIVIRALKQYINDQQDYITANTVFNQNNKRYTHEEVMSELDL
jgi:RHH-type rel operon transcriptional repressor/antitoxin RelB